MSSLRRGLAACVLFAILLLTIAAPEAHASASTSIRDLQYSRRVVLSASAFAEGIPVTFTVSWAGASAGYNLVLSIWDVGAQNFADGRADMSSCAPASSLGQFSANAICGINNIRESGQEMAKLLVQLRSPRNYRLSARAILFDSYGNLRTESESAQDFSIEATNTLQLTVSVPTGVTVTVDGTAETSYAGSVSISLLPGAHQILVPDMVPIDDVTRLRFDHWADGATSASRFATLNDDAQFEVIYVKQFRLAASSSYGNSTGSGWYDEGFTATFSVVTPQPMSSLYGLLGGKYVFDHWSGDSAATAPTASLMMDKPGTVKAEWRTDYTMPYIVIGAIAAAVAIVVLLLAMRKRRRPETAAATAPAPPTPQASIAAPPTVTADKFCMNCGASLPAHATFCNKCGSKQ